MSGVLAVTDLKHMEIDSCPEKDTMQFYSVIFNFLKATCF